MTVRDVNDVVSIPNACFFTVRDVIFCSEQIAYLHTKIVVISKKYTPTASLTLMKDLSIMCSACVR